MPALGFTELSPLEYHFIGFRAAPIHALKPNRHQTWAEYTASNHIP